MDYGRKGRVEDSFKKLDLSKGKNFETEKTKVKRLEGWGLGIRSPAGDRECPCTAAQWRNGRG